MEHNVFRTFCANTKIEIGVHFFNSISLSQSLYEMRRRMNFAITKNDSNGFPCACNDICHAISMNLSSFIWTCFSFCFDLKFLPTAQLKMCRNYGSFRLDDSEAFFFCRSHFIWFFNCFSVEMEHLMIVGEATIKQKLQNRQNENFSFFAQEKLRT